MIPRTIHYCWFGKNPKPKLARKCIKSWKKKCPDYEIIEWNEDNFDISTTPLYVRQAYEAKKWAFVSDYARLWIIYTHGGVYLDTDVELIKPIDDLLSNKAYFGLEKEYINTGLGFGAEKGHKFIHLMMVDYNNSSFLDSNGSFDLTPCPIKNTKAIAHYLSDETLKTYGVNIYDSDYFNPYNASTCELKITQNTKSIHWYNASWFTDEQKIFYKHRIYITKCEIQFGHKMGNLFGRISYAILHPIERKKLKKL